MTSIRQWLRRIRPGGTATRVWLECRDEGVAWAAVGPGTGLTAGRIDDSAEGLARLVTDQGWQGASATLVLSLDQYQVFQMERPAGVADNELADALTWKLKDLLDFPPAEAVADVFAFPEDAARGQRNLVNVAAARMPRLAGLVERMTSAGLTPDRVEIAELALRTVTGKASGTDRSSALVHLSEAYGHLVICRGGQLYLSRRLDVSTADLRDVSRQENAVQTLALEIQRSLDYYESQLGQVPPATVYLVARDTALPLPSMLSSYLAATISEPDPATFGVGEFLDSRCLVAVSAALTNAPGDDPQQVSLLPRDLPPHRQPASARMALATLALLMAILIGYGAWMWVDNQQLARRLAATDVQNQSLQSSLDRLSQAVAGQKPSPELSDRLSQLDLALARRQRLLEVVSDLALGQAGTLSPMLVALAEQVPANVWLTEVQLSLSPTLIRLDGRAGSPDLVPTYLQRLGQTDAFAGRSLSDVRMDQPEHGNGIEFHVATDRTEGGGS